VFCRGLRGYSAALAVTSNPDLADALRKHIPEVRTAAPLPNQTHASVPPLEVARALGGGIVDTLPIVIPRPEHEAEVRPLLGQLPARFLALHPGSGSARKNWPAERFVTLAGRLARDQPFLVVVGPADEGATLPFHASRAVFARGLPLRALGALLAQAGLYVGNDSGVTHLAAAFGAPTLALFGPTDPKIWSPLGPKVRVVRAPQGRLEMLEVAIVQQEAGMLSGVSERSP
jgi:ADP-heptose:LPS heptosyltransferase